MTPEAVAAKRSPEEAKRLSQVRNIGVAVGSRARGIEDKVTGG
jgi:hypothetical protein